MPVQLDEARPRPVGERPRLVPLESFDARPVPDTRSISRSSEIIDRRSEIVDRQDSRPTRWRRAAALVVLGLAVGAAAVVYLVGGAADDERGWNAISADGPPPESQVAGADVRSTPTESVGGGQLLAEPFDRPISPGNGRGEDRREARRASEPASASANGRSRGRAPGAPDDRSDVVGESTGADGGSAGTAPPASLPAASTDPTRQPTDAAPAGSSIPPASTSAGSAPTGSSPTGSAPTAPGTDDPSPTVAPAGSGTTIAPARAAPPTLADDRSSPEVTTASSSEVTTASSSEVTTASSSEVTTASSSTEAPASTPAPTSPPSTAAPTSAEPPTTPPPAPSTAAPTSAETTATAAPRPGGALVWEENFDRLDGSRWALEHSTYGDGNNELQCYRPENVRVSGGRLVLRAVDETYTCPNGSTRQVTSGMVRSRGLRFEPGQALEFRVKLTPADPANQGGLWPAVWSSGWAGGGWPRSGELDYLEVMTAEDPARSVYSIHYARPNGSHGVTNRPAYGADDFSADWHTVRFEYGRDGALEWFLDGRSVHRVDEVDTIQGSPAPFDQPIDEIKINLALGGRPGPLDLRALGESGATFEVDYIRVVWL